ncbi:MAG TPA: hypothetical protein ENJ77_00720 [Candidatus Moranbacteria bacterium]|nr:hypothetical protein [Candidatus Moranbacteria bacterium]
MLASRPFNEGLSGWLCLDFDSSTAAGATYGACDGTLYRFGNGRLVHNSAGEKSVFARRIHISTVGENMTVISYVKWEDGSFPTSPTDTAACNLRSKCSFAIATLSAWR